MRRYLCRVMTAAASASRAASNRGRSSRCGGEPAMAVSLARAANCCSACLPEYPSVLAARVNRAASQEPGRHGD